MKKSTRALLVITTILSFMLLITSILAIHYYKENQAATACELINTKTIYLAINESITIDINNDIDSEYVTYANGILTGISIGDTIVDLGDCNNLKIIVTDLYTTETLNNNKQYLPDNRYTYEENLLLDEALAYYINNAGYKTRAGVVEAARFLLLRFEYKLNYFYENGRLGKTEIEDICDGEGRYYHYGLYLSEEKYSEISPSFEGPAYWGKQLFSSIVGEIENNGLDCSGFISWALYNAGYDCGDIGAGPSEDSLDFSDFGELAYIYDVDIDKLKVGDLVGFDGHIAIIIGMDEDNIYIGEAYWEGDLHVTIQTYREFIEDSDWEYVMYMDSYYQSDGQLSDMW